MASRTHFEVLGFEAYKFSKMPCARPRITLFFDLLKMGCGYDLFFFFARNIAENLRFFARRLFLKNASKFAENLRFFAQRLFFSLESTFAWCSWSLASSILVLGLEKVCPRKVGPWPQIFFVSLALSFECSTPLLIVSVLFQ